MTARRNLLFLDHILLYGTQRGVTVALLLYKSAGGQVPLVLVLQARVLLTQITHLLLQLLDPNLLLLQQLLLGLDDFIQLFQVLRRLAGILGRVFHVDVREMPIHGANWIRRAGFTAAPPLFTFAGAADGVQRGVLKLRSSARPLQRAVQRVCAAPQ